MKRRHGARVFVQIFKAITTFRGDSKLSTWIYYRVSVNLCKNRMKYLSRRHTDGEDELEPVAERAPLDEAKGVTFGDVPLLIAWSRGTKWNGWSRSASRSWSPIFASSDFARRGGPQLPGIVRDHGSARRHREKVACIARAPRSNRASSVK